MAASHLLKAPPMESLSQDTANPEPDETTTLPDLGDPPVGLARFFSRNAPWLVLRRRKNTDPALSQASPRPDDSDSN